MKKIAFLFAFLIVLGSAYSQSQRLVLLEEFTSATCGPCVSKNTQFHTWQTSYPDKFTSIYYHVNWPAAGDPMNLANPGEVSTRVSYYMSPTNMYVPYSVLDGNYYNGSAGGWSMTTINNRYAEPSPFEVQAQHRVNANHDTIFSTVLVKCTQDITASMTLHNVIIEKYIHFNSAPCASSNGERDFYNVMKKMIPGSGGTYLPSTMAAGDYVLIEGSWKPGLVYDFSQIASVAFVQDRSTKEIYQTTNSSADAIVLPYNTDLEVMEVGYPPAKTCYNIVSPVVKVRNNGNNTVTSMTIHYKINEGTWSSYNWNGSLSSLQKASITLPSYAYNMLPSNVLTVYTSDPNSIADQYPKNDTLNFTFGLSPSAGSSVKVSVRTDSLPQETTWEIRNSLNTVVASGGPYTIANKLYQVTVPITVADCYTFTIYDAGANGICCLHGNGGYEVSSNGSVIKQGGAFNSSEMAEFWKEAPVTVAEKNAGNPLVIAPNPFDGSASVSYSLGHSGEVSFDLFTAFGQKVMTLPQGMQETGQHQFQLEGKNLAPGVYVLRMNAGGDVVSRKISVIR